MSSQDVQFDPIDPSKNADKAFTILGAGTLGRRIALMWLTQGGLVHLFDSNPDALKAAQKFVDESLANVLRDQVPDGRAGTLKVFTDRSEALEGSWMVTEAVPEILDLKINLLGELDELLPTNVILATNSSSYSPSEMSEKVKNKFRLVATHYYMPPQSLPIEVMPTKETSDKIAPLILREAGRVGLKPFHVRKESVGLMANRIWAAIKRECLLVAAEGIATPGEIDEIFKLALGNVAVGGPFRAMDQVGLDVVLDIETHYSKVRDGCPPLVREYLKKKVDANELGNKTGQGFFDHHDIASKTKKADKIIYLDIVQGSVQSISTDGTGSQVLVEGLKNSPDGVQVDTRSGKEFIYWTSMGKPRENDGAVWRSKLDGSQVEAIVQPGQTHTPKQLFLDPASDKLLWCDREGGRIQRANLDGSDLETLYDSAPGEARPLADGTQWCVGISFDPKRNTVYWSQKGSSKGWNGRIFRAAIPQGQDSRFKPENVETLLKDLPEPIDLEVDGESETLFWTDRGDPPFGNTLNKISIAGAVSHSNEAQGPSKDLIVAERFHETIGLALDLEQGKAYVADLLGSLWSVELETGRKTLLIQDKGNFTGIALVKA